MSGRIRTIKPEWLEDELLAAASDEARVLSVALLLMADDYGRGRASPAAIAAGAWRYQLEKDDGEHTREILARASRALRELAELRFVTLYEVSGQRYYAIRTWSKHQKVDRPSKPRIPEPPEQSEPGTAAISATCTPSTNTREGSSSPSRDTRQTLAPDLRSPTSTSDLRPASEDRSSARAPEPEHECRPKSIEPARQAIITAYQKRGLSVPGAVASNAPNYETHVRLAGLNVERLPAMLDAFFGDPEMDSKGFPIGWFLGNPNQWARPTTTTPQGGLPTDLDDLERLALTRAEEGRPWAAASKLESAWHRVAVRYPDLIATRRHPGYTQPASRPAA